MGVTDRNMRQHSKPVNKFEEDILIDKSMYSGCSICQVEDCPSAQYRGSQCSALRYSVGTDYDPLTQAEIIRNLDDIRLRDFIFKLSNGYRPWCGQASGKRSCSASKNECMICMNGWLSSQPNKPEKKVGGKEDDK